MAVSMANSGWIKLHRELLDKSIWQTSTSDQKVIMITLLLMANHKAIEWEWQGKKYVVQPGQFITSLPSITKKCGKGITIQKVRTALLRFEKYEFLTSKSTNKNRLITIVNWDSYQSDEENQQAKQQASNKQLTANKNDNNEKKNIYSDDFETFYKVYPNPKGKAQTYKNWKKVIKQHDPNEIIECAKRYQRSLRPDTEKAYITTSYNFLGQKQAYLDYLQGSERDQRQREHITRDIFRFEE
ncbi:hypothetical protein J3A84_05270 [Proteiniclasticum sp. SCR006]|uniref:Replication protein n=1 Tax=Proteiniclasticum aestuarii TaxID=2817862 RepID=A0A939KIX5_9CLOT|nr:hypothetical protein [Proteiniclasticum aestuarii]MBO1264451.1 hypothetical protein [Proteiniclasticum aestuarii]